MYHRRTYALIAFLLFAASAQVVHAATAAECAAIRPGTRPAVADDLIVKQGTRKVGECYNPNDLGVMQTGLEAKEYLKKLPCPSGNCDFGKDFNDSFAICAANFFKAYQSKYGPVQINSAYRSPEREKQICRNNPACGVQMNNPNPTSNHSRGVAIDVQPGDGEAKYPLLWGFAKENPSFGVCFPFENGGPPGGSFKDRPHMILSGLPGSQEAASCVRRGYGNKPCDAGKFDPSSLKDAAAGPIAATTPTSAVANFARQMLGLSTQPILPPQPPLPPQPYAQAQPIATAFMQPTPVMPSSVTPTTGAPSQESPAGTTPIGGVADQLYGDTQKTSATGTSLADRLQELAFGVSTSGATSGIPFIPLIIDPNDRSDTSATTSTATTARFATGTRTIISQNTFASHDLSFQPSYVSFAQSSGFAQTLARIRSALLSMLQYLQPFMLRASSAVPTETY